MTYDLSNVVAAAHPLPKGCGVTVRGIAPGAGLLATTTGGDTQLTAVGKPGSTVSELGKTLADTTGFKGAVAYEFTSANTPTSGR